MIAYTCAIGPGYREQVEAVLDGISDLCWSVHQDRRNATIRLQRYFKSEAESPAKGDWPDLAYRLPEP